MYHAPFLTARGSQAGEKNREINEQLKTWDTYSNILDLETAKEAKGLWPTDAFEFGKALKMDSSQIGGIMSWVPGKPHQGIGDWYELLPGGWTNEIMRQKWNNPDTVKIYDGKMGQILHRFTGHGNHTEESWIGICSNLDLESVQQHSMKFGICYTIRCPQIPMCVSIIQEILT